MWAGAGMRSVTFRLRRLVNVGVFGAFGDEVGSLFGPPPQLCQRVVVEGAVATGRHLGVEDAARALADRVGREGGGPKSGTFAAQDPFGEFMRRIDVDGVLHQHEALVPGNRAFDRGNVIAAVIAQVEAGGLPAPSGLGPVWPRFCPRPATGQ